MRAYYLYLAFICLIPANTVYAADCDEIAGEISISDLKTLASNGDAEATHEIGRRYEYGMCVSQNDHEAISWYQQAYELGHANASYRLGVLYDNGWGATENDEKAVSYFRMAAKQHHAMAQYDLAIMYLNGTGVEQDTISAYKWLLIAVGNGSEFMLNRLSGITKLMTQDQISTAQNLALQFKSEI